MEENINTEVTQEEKKEFSLAKEVFEWVYTIAIALVIAFVIKGFLFDIVQVDGDSMKQTLHDGERLIVTKLGYEPKQGDIVILDSAYKKRESYYEQKEQQEGKEISKWSKMINYIKLPADLKKKYYVKRVIATEGQTVDIINGKVYVDDKRLEEPYYTGMTSTMVEMPQTVEEGHVFVMGDNRPNSLDSRSPSLGQVPEEAVIGASKLRIWPLSKWGWTK